MNRGLPLQLGHPSILPFVLGTGLGIAIYSIAVSMINQPNDAEMK